MASVTIESKKLDLVQLILSVEAEAVVDKVSKYLKRLNSSSKVNTVSRETAEMMENSRKEYAEGKVISFDNAAEAQMWLESL